MKATVYELIGGPQDGGKVKIAGFRSYQIYLGPKHKTDGFCAWSSEPSDRFPVFYRCVDGEKFQHAGRLKGSLA